MQDLLDKDVVFIKVNAVYLLTEDSSDQRGKERKRVVHIATGRANAEYMQYARTMRSA